MIAIHEFLATMVGGKLRMKIRTGRTYYTEVYERVYTATILAVHDGSSLVAVISYDNTPSGYRLADSERSHGEHLVSTADCVSPTEFWDRLIALADPEFARYRTRRGN